MQAYSVFAEMFTGNNDEGRNSNDESMTNVEVQSSQFKCRGSDFNDKHTRHSCFVHSFVIQFSTFVIHDVCSPHSVFAKPLQRPARSSSPWSTARVQGQQPMLV